MSKSISYIKTKKKNIFLRRSVEAESKYFISNERFIYSLQLKMKVWWGYPLLDRTILGTQGYFTNLTSYLSCQPCQGVGYSLKFLTNYVWYCNLYRSADVTCFVANSNSQWKTQWDWSHDMTIHPQLRKISKTCFSPFIVYKTAPLYSLWNSALTVWDTFYSHFMSNFNEPTIKSEISLVHEDHNLYIPRWNTFWNISYPYTPAIYLYLKSMNHSAW